MRTLACLLMILGGLFFSSAGVLAEGQDQQSSLYLYTLDTKWGTLGADISPDSRFVAVEATKGSEGQRGWEIVEEIQVWDWRESKVIARKVLSRDWPADIRAFDEATYYEHFVRYADAGAKLIVYREGRLLVLDSKSLDQVQSIDLFMSEWPRLSHRLADRAYVSDVEVDLHAQRAAAVLDWGGSRGMELRAYDLPSGSLLRKWDLGRVLGRKISLDPQGQRVAIAIMPFAPGGRAWPHRLHSWERNVLIYDVDGGMTTTAINTGYLAGAVRFTPNDTLLTVSGDNTNTRRNPKDTIKIWNAQTGALLREIASPPEGVHFYVQVSADGRVAMAYTGLVKMEGWLERLPITKYHRFRLWDLTTAKVIATSPDLSQPAAPWSHLNLRLSPKGDVVLMYPYVAGGPLLFYELR